MVLSCARGPAHLPRQYGLADGYSDVSVMPLIILGPQLRAVKLQVAETMKALAARSTVAAPKLATTPRARRRAWIKSSPTTRLGT